MKRAVDAAHGGGTCRRLGWPGGQRFIEVKSAKLLFSAAPVAAGGAGRGTEEWAHSEFRIGGDGVLRKGSKVQRVLLPMVRTSSCATASGVDTCDRKFSGDLMKPRSFGLSQKALEHLKGLVLWI